MEYITGRKKFQIEEPTVVSIGKFDGRHRGHQKLMSAMRRLAEQNHWKTAVFTFATAPAPVVGERPLKVITTNEERRTNLEKSGIDYLVEYPFDSQSSHMEPEEFVSRILAGQMNAKAIVAGTDCGFGYKRAGNAELLKKLASRYGYQAEIIEKEQDCHRDISSTYVKEMLDKGEIEKANRLLGEPYSIHGIVVHGNGIGGSRLGFPTANLLPPPEKYLPAFGVYISSVTAGGKIYRRSHQYWKETDYYRRQSGRGRDLSFRLRRRSLRTVYRSPAVFTDPSGKEISYNGRTESTD